MKSLQLGYKVKIGDYEVEVIKKSSASSIRLRLTTKGKFRATCPLTLSNSQLLAFLNGSLEWMNEKYRALNLRNIAYYDGNSAVIFKNRYPVNVFSGTNFNYAFDGNVLTVYKRKNADEYSAVLRALNQILTSVLSVKLAEYNQKTGLYHSGFSVKDLSSVWGRCNYKTKKLNFNLKLLTKPIECIDYVVVHELCHIKIQGHQKDFWAFVESFLPNYAYLKKLLSYS